MHLMYFTEQPMSAYDAKEGLKYGDTRIGPSSTYHLENPDELAEYQQVKAFEVNRAKVYLDKLVASYDWLERELDVDASIHVGHIAVATALGWLEFRGLADFRENRPKLSAWFDAFDRRPSMRATPLSGETHD